MMLPLVQAPKELKWMEQEGLPLAREVLGNADGAIPDFIVLERSFLDNGGGAQNEDLQENPYAPKHGIAAEGKVNEWKPPS
ncbi:hypothetical protein VitviT2T_026607 [Vitis vinifera]|uniref:Uncharacterized protein n=1 Tax=Vitis vinifera TaxID=29760 RepID=A0ABY9DQN5_VITVI|nr:hypothetical protein VitviT2T_026607 [Vitis vinifera]